MKFALLLKIVLMIWTFNEYPQQFNDYPSCLTITTTKKPQNPCKAQNPTAELLRSGVRLYAETAEKPYFKRFSGIEKVHRNSIKITVDLWRRRGDSNSRAGYPTYALSRGASSPT